jgi:hypothetical protein
MAELGGSEVLCLELAHELVKRDYDVTIYSHAVGQPIQGLARDQGIRLTDDEEALVDSLFSLVWIHHQLIPSRLGDQLASEHTTVVFDHMSSYEPLESPFLADIETRLADVVVANSAETAEALRHFGIDRAPVVVFGNPAPDAFWKAGEGPRPAALHKLLLVSNHVPVELQLATERLRGPRLDVDHIGRQGRVSLVTADDMAAADAVVSVGKTVQYALAAGRAVFCYDHHGGPGWLSTANIETARARNFSGRPYGRMDADGIAQAIVSGFGSANGEVPALRQAVSDLTWPSRLDAVLAAAAKRRRKKQAASASDLRRAGAYWTVARRSTREHYAFLDMAHEHGRLTEANRRLDEQLRLKETLLDQEQQRLHTLLQSRSIRVTAPLRSAADLAKRTGRIARHAAKRSRSAPRPQIMRDKDLPPLSWLCRIADGHARIVVGSDVHASVTGIFEGAWIGPFRADGMATSPGVFGSGIVFRDKDLLFVPPSHPMEGLYVLEDEESGTIFVSNSMCFCLAQVAHPRGRRFLGTLGATLQPRLDQAGIDGVSAGPGEMARGEGLRLMRHAVARFRIDDGGVIRVSPVPEAPSFGDFHAYREALSKALGALIRNGADPLRAQPLRPIVAMSSGYDSTATAVLAAENGCREAVTLDVVVTGTHDSGEANARKLGLEVTAFRHLLGASVPDLRLDFTPAQADLAAEFVASGGVDCVAYLPFERSLRHRLLLTGTWGDGIWGIHTRARSDMRVFYPFEKGITEFRLRVGFAFVPVPCIHGLAYDSVAAISRSREMAHFSVGGPYDRPVPRRIGEEAGLARSEFGREKAAVAPYPPNAPGLLVDAIESVRRRYTRVDD